VDRYLPAMLARENNFFAPRSSAETDPSLKQIIPYAILASGGRVLRYKRGKKSGEQRLVAKGSIGIGGHMNDRDEGLFALDKEAYLSGVQREIDEELIIEHPLQNRIAALCGFTNRSTIRLNAIGSITRDVLDSTIVILATLGTFQTPS
jgi:predicted NUDIX family phosphoesterase